MNRKRNGKREDQRRTVSARRRRLFVEQLEQRSLLAANILGGGDANLDDLWSSSELPRSEVSTVQFIANLSGEGEGSPPTEVMSFDDVVSDDPPEEYRSPKVSDYLTRVAYEFDLHVASTPTRDFVPSNSRIRINDGRVYVEAITTGSAAELAAEIASLGAEIVGAFDPGVTAWVPLARIRDLGALNNLTFAKPQFSVGTNNGDSQIVETGNPPSLTQGEIVHLGALPSVDFSSIPTDYKSLRVSDLLSRAAFEYAQFDKKFGASTFSPTDASIRVSAGRVLVEAITTGESKELSDALVSIGGEVLGGYGGVIVAWVPIERLRDLGALEVVKFAKPPVTEGVTNIGNTTTQGDAILNSDDIRTIFAMDGTGQKIGVISDSYNRLGGASGNVASGDLPGTGNPNGNTTPVQVVAELPLGSPITPSDEGRAMLQIIHDIAPKSQLTFATADGGKALFAGQINALRNAGATAIVDDFIYFDEPMFMDGLVAQAADAAVAAGVPYVAAAGNFGKASYEASSFVNSGSLISYGRGNVPMHDFDPGTGVDTFQQITIPANAIVSFILQWQDPFLTDAPTSSGATRDFDFLLLNSSATAILGSSVLNNPASTRDPVEFFTYVNGSTATVANLVIAGVNATGTARLKYVLTDSRVVVNQFATNSPTSFGHANAANVIAVGAANALTVPPTLETFSSAGGIQILFNTVGQAISPVTRQTPDIVGPDNVNNTFFGVDSAGDGDAFPNFAGTSAAAPHIAALLALLKQANPSKTPAQLASALQTTAVDMGVAGYDNDSGFGRVDGLEAQYKLYTPPQAPDLTTSSDNGQSTSDNVTSLTTLTFTGTAPAGSLVTLWDNGSGVFASQDLADGVTSYSLVVSPSANTAHNYSIRVTSGFSSSNYSQFSPSLPVFVDALANTMPSSAPDLLSGSDTGTSNTDNITVATTPTFSGTAAAGDIVTLWIDNVLKGSQTVPGGSSSYSIQASPLGDGAHTAVIRMRRVRTRD